MHQDKKLEGKGIDSGAIRHAAKNFQDGAVTVGYQADRKRVIDMLNGALATELVCVLRYRRHYYTVTGLQNGPVKAEYMRDLLP